MSVAQPSRGTSSSGAATGASGGRGNETRGSDRQGTSNQQSGVTVQTPAVSGPAPNRTGSTDASRDGLRPAAPGIPAGIRPSLHSGNQCQCKPRNYSTADPWHDSFAGTVCDTYGNAQCQSDGHSRHQSLRNSPHLRQTPKEASLFRSMALLSGRESLTTCATHTRRMGIAPRSSGGR